MNLTMRGVSMEIEDAVIVEMIRQRLIGSAYPDNLKLTAAPRIGTVWAGQSGTYAGMARGSESDFPLIVGPEAPTVMDWNEACAWVKSLGDVWRLPLPPEQALCYANVQELFKKEWYWSGKQYEGDSDFAWAQSFGDGYQDAFRKSSKFRVRVVRSLIVID